MHLIIELEASLQFSRLTEGFLEHPAIEFVEVVRIDQIVALDTRLVLEVLVTQAQQLNEIKPLEHRIDLTSRIASRFDAMRRRCTELVLWTPVASA